jgi:predicted permease
MLMLGLCGMVLLVVGLNVSGMMLVRSAIRERELAIRLALGAGRWRLIRYHLSEALALALLGGIVGSAVVFGGPLAVAWAFDLWGLWLNLFRPDVWVALQIIALCFVTSLVLGLLPALRFSRPSVVSALKNDTPGTRRVGWLQRLTAAAQAGLAVPFLVIGGLNLDRARVTAMADLGYEPRGVYAARLPLSAITTTEEERRLFVRTVLDTLGQASGVDSVTVSDGMPLDFTYRNTRIAIDGESVFATVHTTRVGPGYFETLDIPLLAGRAIDATDRDGAERVVVLSEPLAASLFPAGDSLGRRVSFGLAGSEPQTYTVVGITGDLVSTQMGNPRPQLFVSLAQQPASTVMVIARGAPSNPAMHGAFEQAVTDGLRTIPGQTAKATGPAHPNVVFRELITGESLIEGSRLDLLSHSAVGGAAAAVALVLAALGVYGVIAFMVATRTREIGVRMALGASRGRVLGDVLGDSLKLVGPGIGVGLLLGVLWVRLLDPSWYPLGGVEPLIYTAAAATAFLVAVVAGIPSARRAARVEPMIAMRAE